MQVILTDDQYRALKRESERTGIALAELIRRALDTAYGIDRVAAHQAVEKSFGAWEDLAVDGEMYVERLRPGLGHRLKDM